MWDRKLYLKVKLNNKSNKTNNNGNTEKQKSNNCSKKMRFHQSGEIQGKDAGSYERWKTTIHSRLCRKFKNMSTLLPWKLENLVNLFKNPVTVYTTRGHSCNPALRIQTWANVAFDFLMISSDCDYLAQFVTVPGYIDNMYLLGENLTPQEVLFGGKSDSQELAWKYNKSWIFW